MLIIQDLRVYKGKISFLPVDSFKNYQPKDKSIKIIKNTSNYKNGQEETSHLNFKYLKSLDKPVPNDWLTICDQFVLFLVFKLPYMGQDFFVSPHSKFDDGELVLAFIKSGVPRLEVLNLFNTASKGDFLENPYINYIKIKAFRLEPLGEINEDLAMMIDGEKVCYGPIQGEVRPGLGKVLCAADC